jgi:recombination protein RecT
MSQMQVVDNKLSPFRQALTVSQKHFEQALPQTVRKYLTPERMTKITLSALSRNPTLLTCSPESVLRSVMDAASLGLEPAGPLGHAYLVPFKNKKTGRMEAQLIVGYRGYIALARRSGEIESVSANVVYARDEFEINIAEAVVEHKPYMPEVDSDEDGDRGVPRGVYCLAKFVGGGRHVEFMTMADVDKIRRRSRASDSGPWVTDYEEMARKTVVRRASKYWPLSTEFAQAMEIEDAAESGEGHAPVIDMPPPEKKPSGLAAKSEAQAPDAPDAPAEAEHAPEAEAIGDEYGPPPMTDEDIAAATDTDASTDSEPKTRQILRKVQASPYRAGKR